MNSDPLALAIPMPSATEQGSLELLHNWTAYGEDQIPLTNIQADLFHK